MTTIEGHFRDNQIFFALNGESNPSEGVKIHHRLTTLFVSSLKVRIRDGDDFKTFYLDKKSLKDWAEAKGILIEKGLNKKQLLFRIKAYLCHQNGHPPLYLDARRKDGQLILTPWADSSIKLANVFQRLFRCGIKLTVVVENNLQKVRVSEKSFKEWVSTEKMSFAQENLSKRELVQKVFEEGKKIVSQESYFKKPPHPGNKDENKPKDKPFKDPTPFPQQGKDKNNFGSKNPPPSPTKSIPGSLSKIPDLEQLLTPEVIKFFTELAQKDCSKTLPTSPRSHLSSSKTTPDKIQTTPNIPKRNVIPTGWAPYNSRGTLNKLKNSPTKTGESPTKVDSKSKVQIPPLKIPTAKEEIPVIIPQKEDKEKAVFLDVAALEKKANNDKKILNGKEALERIYQNHYEACLQQANEILNISGFGTNLLKFVYDFKTHAFSDVELKSPVTGVEKIIRDQTIYLFEKFAKNLCLLDTSAKIDEVMNYLFSKIRYGDQMLPEGREDFIHNTNSADKALKEFKWFRGLLQRIQKHGPLEISNEQALAYRIDELKEEVANIKKSLLMLDVQIDGKQEDLKILLRAMFAGLPRHPIAPTDLGKKVIQELNHLESLLKDNAIIVPLQEDIFLNDFADCMDASFKVYFDILGKGFQDIKHYENHRKNLEQSCKECEEELGALTYIENV